MATLTVENVGPIRKAELDIKKHTVFIGPQGSGKSTLAKLIAIGGDKDVLPTGEEIGDPYGYARRKRVLRECLLNCVSGVSRSDGA
jgi:predicted ATPase